MTTRMPVLFIGHGSPLTAFEDNQFTRGWTRLVSGLQPRAVLCISAHWYIRGSAVTAMPHPRTIHDFYGFPDALYQFHYPAPGDPQLAQRVSELLPSTNILHDQQWGFDHGCWAVMKHLVPQANLPVVQLSIDGTHEPQWHYDVGRQLAALRDEGVLIIGSGNVVHNLQRIRFTDGAEAFPWATLFDQHVYRCIESFQHQPLIDYQQADEALHQAAMLSVPTPEHYLPLLYALGASNSQDSIQIVLDEVVLGSVSMLSVKFG